VAHDFRPYQLDQQRLFATDPREWLPSGHLALFLADVVGQLDLRPIVSVYTRGRGPRGYHPQMLLTVLLYGYCQGIFSSRRIAQACETDIAFRALSGGELPDFRTLCDFRKRHLAAMRKLFLEVLRLCREAGLVKVGHLSLDGSKYQANASKHKAMSYGRIGEVEPKLESEVKELLERAERVDREEDGEHGSDKRGDELPEELRRREARLEKIRAAKVRLEARARARVRDRLKAKGASAEEIAEAEGKAEPGPKEQSNFTDPDSRIMKTKSGWVQGYNSQLAVDAESGVILAEEVSAQSADSPRLSPMLDQVEENLKAIGVAERERRPKVFTADAGYCSEANLESLEARKIDAYVATGREKHHRRGVDIGGAGVSEATQTNKPTKSRTPKRAAMRAKLQTDQGRAIYARRKCIVEPVHGLIKQARGFRQFLLRGMTKVSSEFTLIALTHNLLKLWRAQTMPTARAQAKP
jgi:transposase